MITRIINQFNKRLAKLSELIKIRKFIKNKPKEKLHIPLKGKGSYKRIKKVI